MGRIRTARTPSARSRHARLAQWLDAPVSSFAMTLVRLGATAAFVALSEWMGGATPGDAYVVTNPSWAVASGHLACAYPTQVSGPGVAPPLYPLVTGALAALLRIGHSVAFPSAARLGAHCENGLVAIDRWSRDAGAIAPTLALGYVAWLAAAAGAIALVRALGRGRGRWEAATVVSLALIPPIPMCIGEYFHPQDLMAVGLVLGATSCVLRGRWLAAGALVGLAVSTQQLAVLALVALLVAVPPSSRLRFLAGGLVAAAMVDLPFLVASSGRALTGVLVGTGAPTPEGGTLLDGIGVGGHGLLVLSRALPILVTLAVAWWAVRAAPSRRLGASQLVSLVLVALTLRLVFEVSLYGYYLAPVAAAFLGYGVARREIPRSLVVWVLVVIAADWCGGLSSGPTYRPLPVWFWQVLLAAIPLVVGLRHLATSAARHEVGATIRP